MRNKEVIRLETKEETLTFILAGKLPDSLVKYAINSVWICERMNEYEKDGFVYNADAVKKLEVELGITDVKDVETGQGVLGVLVYNAQDYRVPMKMKVLGYTPLTNELILEALNTKKKIEILHDSIFGESKMVCRPVRTAEGGVAVLKPRSNTRGYVANPDLYGKIV